MKKCQFVSLLSLFSFLLIIISIGTVGVTSTGCNFPIGTESDSLDVDDPGTIGQQTIPPEYAWQKHDAPRDTVEAERRAYEVIGPYDKYHRLYDFFGRIEIITLVSKNETVSLEYWVFLENKPQLGWRRGEVFESSLKWSGDVTFLNVSQARQLDDYLKKFLKATPEFPLHESARRS